jgi:hypothetical protein
MMSWLDVTQLWYYVYKGHWEDALVPSFYFLYFSRLRSLLVIELGFPPVYSSELPLQAERAVPYLSTIVASENLWYMIRLGFISTLIRSCLSQPCLSQTCSHWAQGPVEPWHWLPWNFVTVPRDRVLKWDNVCLANSRPKSNWWLNDSSPKRVTKIVTMWSNSS